MRLLNTATLMLEEFFDKKPPYAILSHTWGSEEVAFADLQGERSLLEDKSGYKKVKGCCAIARNDDFDWVWIHTCCIDKTSSAELSEAINSMFQWYQEAVICYAYLIDVPHLKYAIFLAHENLRNSNQEMASVFDKEKTMFTGSRWFSRGWTLQELLAPRNIVFFATDWSCIGTKEELAELIEKSTGITRLALQK
ncbi:Vegetative incompatibility protein HET-E-1 [Colletotrichum aenigma]|uniref:Vegetative incompatibility protein HET-E-1 n=1 Tax=Colletotrichum aenigma TaxID=1215731 RepID=UPI001872C8CA|nr:Vegetative incompatibility protein HET-E-1 [Colletotrichum aenigma]KAF5522596.1 Vegetative incompatibility protein HET-E-1 [Colletotrichum aenigma]